MERRVIGLGIAAMSGGLMWLPFLIRYVLNPKRSRDDLNGLQWFFPVRGRWMHLWAAGLLALMYVGFSYVLVLLLLPFVARAQS